jgi:hypothetical protein
VDNLKGFLIKETEPVKKEPSEIYLLGKKVEDQLKKAFGNACNESRKGLK